MNKITDFLEKLNSTGQTLIPESGQRAPLFWFNFHVVGFFFVYHVTLISGWHRVDWFARSIYKIPSKEGIINNCNQVLFCLNTESKGFCIELRGNKRFLFPKIFFFFLLEFLYLHHCLFSISLKIYTPWPFDKMWECLM